MALISDLIPSLLNGVSQQAPTVKDKSQGDLQENGYSDPVRGLKKRPSTQHVAKLSTTSYSSSFIHPIRRSGTETFIAVLSGTGSAIGDLVKIYDANDGSAKTVNARDASNSVITSGTTFDEIKAYLTDGSPDSAFTATTVADFTYLVNKNKVVAKGSTVTTARNPEALVYVRGGDYANVYSIEIKPAGQSGFTEVAKVTTAKSAQSAGEANIATDKIAKALTDGTAFGDVVDDGSDGVGKIKEDLDNVLGSGIFSNLSATVSGSVIHIKSSNATDFEIRVTDSRSNGFIQAFKDSTLRFAELPGAGPTDAKDMIIKITGDNSKFADDFYVKLTDETKGIYEETVATGLVNDLNASTLPIQIIKETDGSFSIKQADWKNRVAGDDDSNPFPSFVGSTISDIFFHQNRLGVLSEESVVFTEAGEFLNWFRPTVLNLLDTDPIDVTVSTNRVSILKHALPFSESLLIFSDQTQFILNSAEFLSPLDISLNVTTEFEADLNTTPVGAGRYVFFASPGGAFSTIREFYLQTDTEVKDATDVTGHVPRYIAGGVKQMTASSNYNMMCLITDDTASSKIMWVYSYYWNGQNKVQSSWSQWKFDADILAITFVQDEIFMVVQRASKVYLEKIKLSQDEAVGATSNQHEILLDRRVKITNPTHLTGTNFNTTYYDDGSSLKYVNKSGDPITLAQAQAMTGDNAISATNPIYVGQAYNFKFQFSEIIVGQGEKPQTISRLQLRNITLNFAHTGNFTARVTHTNRITEDTDDKQFTGRKVSQASNKTNQTSIISSGSFKVPLLGNSKNIKLELLSSSHLPCEFQSAEWEGFYHIRSRREG
tara:strand:- start:1632 stop:4121 length:2490 start_codon:yes stop_codon:yes gene_type:complete